MIRLSKSVWLTSLAMLLCAGPSGLLAQPGPPNFDPAEMRRMMIEQFRERLEVKNDDEWKIVQDRIGKVLQARLEATVGMMMGGRMFGGRGGGGNQPGFLAALGLPPNLEMEALQNCLDANASSEVIKARLASLREARRAKEAKLEKAQQELKQLLTLRQEAAAVMSGLLD